MQSPLFGSRHATPTGTVYANFNSSDNAAWDSTEANVAVAFPNPDGGSVTGLTADILSAPGVGNSRTYTLMKNGAASALSVTISDANVTASDTTTTVYFAKGDTISLRHTSTGSPTGSNNHTWYTNFTGEGQPLMLVSASLSGNAQYPLSGKGSVGQIMGVPWAAPGTFSDLRLSVSVAPGGAASDVVTLYKNGVAQALAVTVAGSGTLQYDSTHRVSVSAGDYVYWKIALVSSPATTAAMISAVFTPSFNGTSVVSSSFATSRTPSTSATQYNAGPSNAVWLATENQRQFRLPACAVSKLTVRYSAAPSGSSQWTNTFRVSAADTSLSTTVSGASVAGSDPTNSVNVTAGQALSISSVPGSSPAAAYAEYSFAAFIVPTTFTRRFLGGRRGGRSTANNSDDISYYGLIASGYNLSDGRVMNADFPGATQTTSRTYHVACYDADFVRGVYSLYKGSGAIGDVALANSATVTGSIQRNPAGGHSDQTGQIKQFRFSGGPSLSGTHTWSATDKARFPVRKGERFFLRNGVTLSSTTDVSPGGFRTQHQLQGFDTGDGVSAGDLVGSGTVNIAASVTDTYAAQGVLGYFPSGTIPRSAAMLGDSIFDGTKDPVVFGQGMGSYGERACAGQFGLCLNESVSPTVPFLHLSRGGQFLSQWLANNVVQLPLASLCSTWVSEFCTHDLQNGLATCQSLVLQLAGLAAAAPRVRRMIQCTLVPKMLSSDGFRTIAGQSPDINYVVRYQFNDWVRDPSVSGFVQQAASATGKPASFFKVWDAAYAITVDANNNPTTGPGYWRVPSASAPYGDFAVAATGSPTTTSVRLTPATVAANADIGRVGLFLTGAAATVPFINLWSQQLDAGTTHNIKPTGLDAAPATGDIVRMWTTVDAPSTVDGTHPSSAGHAVIARSLDLSLII